MGDLHFFLGIEVIRCPDGLFHSQHKYAMDILKRTKMTCSRYIHTPLATKHELHDTGGPPVDASEFRSIVGALQYLTLTRPELAHAINLLCQFMQHHCATHWTGVKRVLRYLAGTTQLGLHITAKSSLNLVGFSDADWGGCPITRRSTTALKQNIGHWPLWLRS
ncbi:hypothetical protein KY289_001645 [Solanum tuberosum]|nr:hypothetical protein KY289_001645 [Solanum tuberosum]